MKCKECDSEFKFRPGNSKSWTFNYCVNCVQEIMSAQQEIEFRFQDIEASLQYTPTSRKPNMEEQERKMS